SGMLSAARERCSLRAPRSGSARLWRHLKEQLLRAASSIVLNLAEGYGRQTPGDQKRFFIIAFGSLRESQAILDLGLEDNVTALECADNLAAHIYKLIKNTG